MSEHVSIFKRVWDRLRRSRRYRQEFVAAYARRAIPFQVRAIMKRQGISQSQLAAESGLTQGAISRATNPTYGRLSLNTIIRLAIGLDMGVIIRIVPFSRMVREYGRMKESDMGRVDNFSKEDNSIQRHDPETP